MAGSDGPGTPGFTLDGANGGDTGKIQQDEQQVGKSANLAIEAVLHGAEHALPDPLFHGHCAGVGKITQIQTDRVQQRGIRININTTAVAYCVN